MAELLWKIDREDKSFMGFRKYDDLIYDFVLDSQSADSIAFMNVDRKELESLYEALKIELNK